MSREGLGKSPYLFGAKLAPGLVGLMVALIFLLFVSAGAAKEARPLSDDPELEARVMQIAEDLRCLVCQNETLAASHAGLAVDLRTQIREQLAAGRNAEQVVEFMVARYGDFILYRPPFQPSTWLLWVGPFGLLVVALWVMSYVIRQRRLVGDGLASEDEEPDS